MSVRGSLLKERRIDQFSLTGEVATRGPAQNRDAGAVNVRRQLGVREGGQEESFDILQYGHNSSATGSHMR